MLLTKLKQQELIHPPKWLIDNTVFLTYFGSEAYGVSSGASDIDVYGFCIPPKHVIFPHTAGEIMGFGKPKERFDQWQEHHVEQPGTDRVYDFSVYNIVKYFQLCMDNNPNMIDSLFTPRRCIIHNTDVGEIVRDNRQLFLHKGSWHKFKGYAYSQMHKIREKTNSSNPKRAETIEKYGYDIKFGYHLVRLLCEVEMILVEHDLDIERNSEQLKSIRRGEWPLEQLISWFETKEKALEAVYATSTLRAKPDEDEIKKVLVECLNIHYNGLKDLVHIPNQAENILAEIKRVLDKYEQ